MSARRREPIGEAERDALERAVLAAEQGTSGELVVVIARACDAYASVAWRFAVVLAALAFLATTRFAPGLPAIAYLGAEVGALFLGHALARAAPVLRLLLPSTLVDERVALRARRAFRESGLERTRGATGVLLFVALLEHRVVVLGDRGVDRMLDPDESWQDVVDRVVDGLRRGDLAGGLHAGIRSLGELLARHLPAPARNPDELPNALVLED